MPSINFNEYLHLLVVRDKITGQLNFRKVNQGRDRKRCISCLMWAIKQTGSFCDFFSFSWWLGYCQDKFVGITLKFVLIYPFVLCFFLRGIYILYFYLLFNSIKSIGGSMAGHENLICPGIKHSPGDVFVIAWTIEENKLFLSLWQITQNELLPVLSLMTLVLTSSYLQLLSRVKNLIARFEYCGA